MSKTTEKTLPVTILKRLGTKAPEFELPVTFPLLSGGEAKITLQCKALRKTEWAGLKDAAHRKHLERLFQPPAQQVASATEPTAEDALKAALSAWDENGHAPSVRKSLADDVGLVMAFAIGWDLEDEFSADSVMQLGDDYGGSIKAILEAYDAAIFAGRLGN